MSTNNLDTSTAIFIRSARAGGSRLFCGLQVGPPNAPMNVIVRELMAATEAFGVRADDLQQASLGPLERGDRLRQLSGPLHETLQRAGVAITAARASLEVRMQSASPFPVWGPSTPYYVVMIGLKMVDKFCALRAIEQSARVAMAVSDPVSNAAMTTALLQVPGELTNLRAAQLDAMRVAALKALKPAEYLTLDLEADMVNLAQVTLAKACTSVADGSGTSADLAERAPAAVALRGLAPLTWVSGGDVDDGLGVSMPLAA